MSNDDSAFKAELAFKAATTKVLDQRKNKNLKISKVYSALKAESAFFSKLQPQLFSFFSNAHSFCEKAKLTPLPCPRVVSDLTAVILSFGPIFLLRPWSEL